MNKEEIPIESILVPGIEMAGYSIIENKIYYDKRLDNYPELKQIVLTHEKKHAYHKTETGYHLYLDLSNLTIFFRKDLIEFILGKDLPRPTNKQKTTLIIYQIFQLFLGVLSIPFYLIGLIKYGLTSIYQKMLKRGKQ